MKHGGAGGDVAGDHVVDGRAGGRLVADDAAVGPFDAAIAGCHAGFREHDQAALRVERKPDLGLRAGTAAMNSGDAGAALRLAPLSDAGTDSAKIARSYLPLHARTLLLP